jgi:hypothetical protein
MCHCIACQRRTGSTFGAQARFLDEHVRVAGDATVYERVGDSGGTIRFHFCPTCGATVFYRFKEHAGFTIVPVGTFGDPTFPAPTFSVYEARRHAWTGIPDGAEHMD